VYLSLEFSNGDREVERFRMIERHYFRDQLVKSFDFKFGFVPPNTRNSWDVIYDIPMIDPDLVTEMLKAPYETRSDSFYFVGDELIMHNMAEYRYTENSIEAQGKANAENMPDPVSSSSTSGGAGGKTAESGAGQKRNRGNSKFDDGEDEEDEDSGAGTKFSYK
jgi:protein unc-119